MTLILTSNPLSVPTFPKAKKKKEGRRNKMCVEVRPWQCLVERKASAKVNRLGTGVLGLGISFWIPFVTHHFPRIKKMNSFPQPTTINQKRMVGWAPKGSVLRS